MFQNWQNEQKTIYCFIAVINWYMNMRYSNNLESLPLYGSVLDSEQ